LIEALAVPYFAQNEKQRGTAQAGSVAAVCQNTNGRTESDAPHPCIDRPAPAGAYAKKKQFPQTASFYMIRLI